MNLPSAGCYVLEYKENQCEEHQPLHTNANLQYLAQILDKFISHLHDLQEPDHPSHLDHFVELSYSCEPRYPVHAPGHKHQIKGYHRDQIDEEP